MIGSTNTTGSSSSTEPIKAFINVTTPSEELYNRIVTCTYEVDGVAHTLLGGMSSDGTCTFGVPELTTYTITCNGVTATAEVVEENTSVSVELRLAKAILNLTTSNLNGQVVTVTVGSSTYTATFVDSKCTITLYEFGTATIACEDVTATKAVEDGGTYTVDLQQNFTL